MVHSTPISSLLKNSPLSRRFTIITVMFLTVLLGLLIYTIATIHKERSNAILIDMAGRQRMLLQKHMGEIFLTSQGFTTDYTSTRDLIRSTLHALMEGGSVVLDPATGKKQTIPAIPTEELLLKLREQEKHFDKIIELGDDLLLLPPNHPEFRQKLKFLRARNSTLIAIADDAVKQLDRHAESNMTTMVKWESIIALFVGLLGIYITRQGIRDGRKIEREILERQRAEEKLRSTEELYRQILDSIPDMVLVKDLNFKIFWANKSFRSYYNMTNEELKGILDASFNEPDFTKRYNEDDSYVFTTGKVLDIPEEPVTRHDGQVFIFHTIKAPLFNENGKALKSVGVSRDITERKQTEEIIRKGERKFRAIYEQAPTGIAILDSISGRFIQCNHKYSDITGYSPEEMRDRTFQEITHPDDLQADLDQMQQLLCGQIGSFQMEKRYIHKNGAIIWVNLICVPLWLEPTDPREHMAMVEDITYRKQGEKALQESEERFRILYEDNPSMYFTVAQDGTVLSVNRFGAQQLGYTGEELVGQPVIDLFVEEDKPFVQQRFETCLKNPLTVDSWEFRKVRKDKSIVWVKEVVRAVHNRDGEFVVLINCEDISERKETEKALKEWKTLTESVLGQLPKGFAYRCLNDKNWTAIYVSEGIEEVTGFPSSALLSGTINYNSLLAPDENERVWANVQEALARHLPYENEHRIITRDGTTKWILARGRFIFDDAGQLLYLDGLNVDITERKRAEERFRESEAKRMDALRQSDELKSALLASVSHELRTPLTAMKGSVSSIMGNSSGRKDQKREDALKGIDREINYMSHLVDNLLDMSQIEAGTLIPHKEWHLLEDLTEGALRRAAQTLDTRNIAIDIPEDVPPIFVDAVEIQQVLLNLIDNAVKYSFPHSPIQLLARIHPQQIEVVVSNTGETIPAQDLVRIFERFYRGRSPREEPIRGTGLGLAICKGIIEAHGGRIWAESIGKEVTIAFTIPTTESMADFSLEGLHKR